MKWAMSLALMLGGASTQVSIAKLSRSTAGEGVGWGEMGWGWGVRGGGVGGGGGVGWGGVGGGGGGYILPAESTT